MLLVGNVGKWTIKIPQNGLFPPYRVYVRSTIVCDFIRRAPILQFLAISMQKQQPTSDISVSHYCGGVLLISKKPQKDI